MNSIDFPITLNFRIGTLANDFNAKNSRGETIAYVREKILKFVDEIDLYSDESKTQKLYTIKADRWLDFNSNYSFNNANGDFIGSLARKGWASLWRARYESYDASRRLTFLLQEENPFIKILDGILGEIPVLGFLVGYFFNPKYTIKNPEGILLARMIKLPSFWGRKFNIVTYDLLSVHEAELLFLSVTELALQERRRG